MTNKKESMLFCLRDIERSFKLDLGVSLKKRKEIRSGSINNIENITIALNVVVAHIRALSCCKSKRTFDKHRTVSHDIEDQGSISAADIAYQRQLLDSLPTN